MFNITEHLEKKGHEVIPFSVQHKLNKETPHARNFLSPLGTGEEVYFKDMKKDFGAIQKMISRSFYSFEAKKKVKRAVKENDVQIAYVMNFLRWMSPSILHGLKEEGIPIVVRLSEFMFICQAQHLMRDGKHCDLCVKGSHWNAVKHKCVRGSYGMSLMNSLSVSLHHMLKSFDKIDAFVVPSKYTIQMMIEGGFPAEKFHHVPTFVNPEQIQPEFEVGDYILYFGRISEEKGLSVLIDGFADLKKKNGQADLKLVLAGRATGGEIEVVKEKIKKNNIKGVEMVGELSGQELQETIKKSAFTVIPSIWNDNMPNSLIESYACAKAVITSDIDSMRLLVDDGKTGLLFKTSDHLDLSEKMGTLISDKALTQTLGKQAYETLQEKYTSDTHYDKLHKVFQGVM